MIESSLEIVFLDDEERGYDEVGESFSVQSALSRTIPVNTTGNMLALSQEMATFSGAISLLSTSSVPTAG